MRWVNYTQLQEQRSRFSALAPKDANYRSVAVAVSTAQESCEFPAGTTSRPFFCSLQLAGRLLALVEGWRDRKEVSLRPSALGDRPVGEAEAEAVQRNAKVPRST